MPVKVYNKIAMEIYKSAVLIVSVLRLRDGKMTAHRTNAVSVGLTHYGVFNDDVTLISMQAC